VSTSGRRSIEIDGLSHLAAIPVGTRIGPLVVSSVINSFDPGTRDVPEATADQIVNVFAHVQQLLDEAGASWEHVAKMEFWVPNSNARAELDAVWKRHFPDEAARPSRHTHVAGESVKATVMAWVAD
jgi:enamine deaminase RidA (YjgF/YER057c/UK114 family)